MGLRAHDFPLENQFDDIIYLCAVAHDQKEDQGYEESVFVSQLEMLGFKGGITLYESLSILNKGLYKNYLEYILAVKKNWISTIVKRADLRHNMSDLQEGSLKDKYRLAEYILTH